MSSYSTNEHAAEIVGLRTEYLPENANILDFPCELGYHCPVCKYKDPKGGYDERLEWSEYRGFIWCRVCDKDYPSALCQPNIDKAIDAYLACVKEATERTLNLKESKHKPSPTKEGEK